MKFRAVWHYYQMQQQWSIIWTNMIPSVTVIWSHMGSMSNSTTQQSFPAFVLSRLASIMVPITDLISSSHCGDYFLRSCTLHSPECPRFCWASKTLAEVSASSSIWRSHRAILPHPDQTTENFTHMPFKCPCSGWKRLSKRRCIIWCKTHRNTDTVPSFSHMKNFDKYHLKWQFPEWLEEEGLGQRPQHTVRWK